MQHDLFQSGHDLDIDFDLGQLFNMTFKSNHSSLDASQQEEHDAGKINVVALLSHKLLSKNVFRKNGYF